MRSILVVPFIVVALLLAACTPPEGGVTGDAVANTSANNTTDNLEPVNLTANTTGDTAKPAETQPQAKRFVVEGTEGELIELKPAALDPDGDRLSFTFTKPFDKDGRWLTRIGDEGTYDVVIGASDGRSTTTETVSVIVHRANRAPVIECKNVTVNEGEIVDLHQRCAITDEDDSNVIVMYSGWMTSWRYQTTYDDAGTHTVMISASDKRNNQILHTVEKNVTVTVKDVNRAPQFLDAFPSVISATENDVVTLPHDLVRDPDRDPVTLTFSSPFNSDGVWRTKLGDAGSYDVDVVASDGRESTKRTVKLEVKMLNTAPVLKLIPDITVNEGETVKLPVSAYDREGDKLTTRVEGWMTGDTLKTGYDDAGSYTVKVTVSDGVYNTSQIVHVTVVDVNRPPVFVSPA